MSIEATLQSRSNSSCELCSSTENLKIYEIPPDSDGSADQAIYICEKCYYQIEGSSNLDVNHWHCLNDSMWSEFPAVQVVAYRMLKKLSSESWACDLLEQIYLDEDTLKWAESGIEDAQDAVAPTKDSNGNSLQAGDTVTLIKDLDVKGAGFTAKRGTIVKNISLTDNPLHIEGKVNRMQLVLVAAYLKKVN